MKLLFQTDTVFKNTAFVYMNMYLVVYKSQCLSVTLRSPVRNTFQALHSFGSSTSMFSSVAVWDLVVKYSLVSRIVTVISSCIVDMVEHAVEWWCTHRPNRDINSLYCSLDQVMEDLRNRH